MAAPGITEHILTDRDRVTGELEAVGVEGPAHQRLFPNEEQPTGRELGGRCGPEEDGFRASFERGDDHGVACLPVVAVAPSEVEEVLRRRVETSDACGSCRRGTRRLWSTGSGLHHRPLTLSAAAPTGPAKRRSRPLGPQLPPLPLGASQRVMGGPPPASIFLQLRRWRKTDCGRVRRPEGVLGALGPRQRPRTSAASSARTIQPDLARRGPRGRKRYRPASGRPEKPRTGPGLAAGRGDSWSPLGRHAMSKRTTRGLGADCRSDQEIRPRRRRAGAARRSGPTARC